jgi:hypothetical protein
MAPSNDCSPEILFEISLQRAENIHALIANRPMNAIIETAFRTVVRAIWQSVPAADFR